MLYMIWTLTAYHYHTLISQKKKIGRRNDMFKYRPHRGSLDEAMKEAKEFITMDQMFDYIVKNDPLHVLQKEDLYITEDHGKDLRIDWKESRYVMAKRYGKNDYPMPIGLCSMEDFYNIDYFAKAKNIYIGGISRHHLLKMLYDAAKPYDKTISIDEAADALHNTVGTVTQLKGKRLYVNVFGKEFDGTEYDKINGIGLSYRIVTYITFYQLWGEYLSYRSNKTSSSNLYRVTCSVGLDFDLILIGATSEMEAWDKFWEHYKDEPNLNHEDFGSKDDYEYIRGYWKKKGSIVSITIEPINFTSDFLYIGGGRNV